MGMARVAHLTIVGSLLQGDLVARLLAHPVSAPYSFDGRTNRMTFSSAEKYDPDDMEQQFKNANTKSVGELKEECKGAGLKSSGNRYELVLSLLRAKAGGAGSGNGGGSAHPQLQPPAPYRARAPSTKAEDPGKITERIVAKWQGLGRKQSDSQIKSHASDCFGFAAGILTKVGAPHIKTLINEKPHSSLQLLTEPLPR